ncbi:MAG: MFS transporter [Phycisphaerales bacterium]
MTRTEADQTQPAGAPASLPAPVRLTRHVFVSFLPSSMPLLSRMNYRRELTAAFFFPLVIACVEGGVIGVLVRNAFEGVVDDVWLNFVVAGLVAAPAFANVASFVWVRMSHGLHKIRFINALQIGMIASVALIALPPRTPLGLVMICTLALSARLCYAGIVTLRATVWGVNYPRHARARVAGKLSSVQVEIVAGVGLALGIVLEVAPWAYRVSFPLLALAALIGVFSWKRVRVRGHRRLLRAERRHSGDDRPSLNPLGMAHLLRDDRRYAAYMACQMFLGLGNMMTWAPVVIVVREVFHVGYLGVILTHTVPSAIMPLCIPFWARLLDRRHVVVFRSIHSWVFVISALFAFVSVEFGVMWALVASVAAKGIALGGGQIAWSLGHLDFAPEDKASQYMAVHVTLTGFRGLLAPFLGVTLYELFEQIHPGGGAWMFVVAAVLAALGALGFAALRRAMGPDATQVGAQALPGSHTNP